MRIYQTRIRRRNTKEMLVVSLILITTVFSTNGFPSSSQTGIPDREFQNSEQQETGFQIPEQEEVIFQTPEQQQEVFQVPEEQEVVFQIPEQQEVIFQVPEQQESVYQTTQQKIDQQQPNENYYISDDTQFEEEKTDFTISCIGANKICTGKSNCINGYVDFSQSAIYSPSTQVQQCRVQDQVCCTIKKEFQVEMSDISYEQAPLPKEQIGHSSSGISSQATFAVPTHVELGCAAALLCVEERFCTIDGTISPEPVTLSDKELLRRVPMSSCKNPETGIIGKCCRDPNYVDPWPMGDLPANYSGGFDEQGFPTFLNIAKVKPTKTPTKSVKTPVKYNPVKTYPTKSEQKIEPTLVPENSDIFTKTLIPPSTNNDVKNDFSTAKPKFRCGVRNKVVQQPEAEESQTAFAEISWQAMVLHSKERKILCSGALVSTQDVLTAANCVDSLLPSDVSIKLGEWKLGYELKHEEPLPFQIINVSSISIHPSYTRGNGEHDLAMLHLESPATFDVHINPLCLPESDHLVQNSKPCITTGWGKSILQAHYTGAIMHAVSMDVLSTERCKGQLLNTNIEANIADGTICVAPKEEKNNVCETDVGGPLACQNEHGLYDLAGIYSQDTGCLPTNQVAIFAPLDKTWLKETMFKSIPEESKINLKYDEQSFSDDYRKSTLSTDNQYLPPF